MFASYFLVCLGTLVLPWTYDFSQLLVAVFYLLTALFGMNWWKIPWIGSIQAPWLLVAIAISGTVFELACAFVPQSG
jgi:hypothetical protein